jgi:uncharacterized protein involved in exopolysaccharide biosynthesis
MHLVRDGSRTFCGLPVDTVNAVPPEDRAPFAEILCWECEALQRPDVQVPAGGAPAAPDSDLSLLASDLPALAWQGKGILALTVIVTLLLGGLYLSTASPVYLVGARLLIEQRALPLQESGRGPAEGKGLPTHAEILRSPAIIRAALDALPEPAPEVVAAASAGVHAATDAVTVTSSETPRAPAGEAAPGEGDATLESPEDRVESVLRAFTATPILGTNILALSYRCGEPQRGIELLDAVIVSFRQYLRDLEQDGQVDTVTLLRTREAEFRKELSDLKQRHLEMRADNALMGESKDALSVQKAMLMQQASLLAEAKGRRIELENQVRAGGGGPSGSGGDVSTIQAELWKAEARAAALAQYGDKHPEMRAVKQQIAALRGYLEESRRSVPVSLEQELAAARGTEQKLAESYRAEFERAKSMDNELQEEQLLMAEIERVSELHQETLTTLREKELTARALEEGQAGIVIRILEGPSLVGDKVWPRPTLVLAQCAVVGGIGGMGILVIRDRARRQRRAQR